MKLSSLESRLFAELEQIPVIDAHEHLPPESERVAAPVDVLTLFSHYTQGDLRVAGMSEAAVAETQKAALPLDYRWGVFAPYWEQIRHSCYARAALIAVRRFYGEDDINGSTYLRISERMAAANTPGIYQRVLGDACNIRTALTQCERTDLGTPLLTPVMPLLPNLWFSDSWAGIESQFRQSGAVASLDDVIAANRAYILRVKSEGAVGLKVVAGPYGEPSRAGAHDCLERLRTGSADHLPPINALRTFLVDEMIRFAGEQDLVVCVHTGYWGDFRELDPLHMIPMLQRHPSVRFDFYHLGYPWVGESIMLGKGFPNVWLNFCWTHIISQRFAMDALDEVIEMVPMNKVIGFGGDYNLPVEKVYGHITMAREDIARVLAPRIERGLLSEEGGIALARKWLWENPKELYRLPL
ncbi:MAG: amidohydrolase family protein [Armatimonadota bacterium]